jgi:hypothetical protein
VLVRRTSRGQTDSQHDSRRRRSLAAPAPCQAPSSEVRQVRRGLSAVTSWHTTSCQTAVNDKAAPAMDLTVVGQSQVSCLMCSASCRRSHALLIGDTRSPRPGRKNHRTRALCRLATASTRNFNSPPRGDNVGQSEAILLGLWSMSARSFVTYMDVSSSCRQRVGAPAGPVSRIEVSVFL